MNRGRSFNRIIARMSLNKDRPITSLKSASSFLSFPNNNITQIPVKSSVRLLTRPNSNSKKLKSKGMGNKFEKEELYELNQQFKSTINNLKAELYAAKGQINKKDREIKKKERIIKNCYKEIQNPSSEYDKSFNKAKESTIISLLREQNNNLIKENEQLKHEINKLEMNIKITNINEYQIQVKTLKSEMKKLINLYKNALNENKTLKKKINDLIEFRNKYSQQHNIINKCINKVKNYDRNLFELELANEELINELNKKNKTTQFFKSQNNKLKLSNEKFMKEKKNREYYSILNIENVNTINKLKKELNDYKLLYNLREQQIKKYEENMAQKKLNPNIKEEVKQFDYNKIIYIEKDPNNEGENNDKIKLLKSLLNEKQNELNTLKNYIISKNILPQQIIDEENIIDNSNNNTNNINNVSNSQAMKNEISMTNLKNNIKNDKNKNPNLNSFNKKESSEKNKNSNLNSINNNKNISNNQIEENNSQLYNEAIINSIDNINENKSEEQIKDSEFTSNNNDFDK